MASILIIKPEYIHLHFDTKDTMKDLKLKRSVSGLARADCIISISKTDD